MIGIDITHTSRIQNLIDRFGQKGLDRFLSNKEQSIANNSASIAGFWAAKEAASKAIGTGIGGVCRFEDIKISKLSSGQPILNYKKHIRKKFHIKDSHLSITHDGDLAIAIVVVTYKKRKKNSKEAR